MEGMLFIFSPKQECGFGKPVIDQIRLVIIGVFASKNFKTCSAIICLGLLFTLLLVK